MDYGTLPPEINSGLMYGGAGSGSLMASAAAWQMLAADLGVSAANFDAVIGELAGASWLGPSSLAMVGAALPYIAWMVGTAAQAEEHALAALQTASAFEMARATVVHPAVIAENRTELATLVATNFLGVNSAAIAANEAEYMGFWATDATTMYGYAAQLAGVSGAMIPFVPPVADANPAGPALQATAVAESGAQSAGQASVTTSQATGQLGALPSGMGSVTSMLGSAPQLLSQIPSLLTQLGSPLQSLGSLASPLQSLSGFQSFFTPLMSMPMLLNGVGTGLTGLGGSLQTMAAFPGVSGGFGGAGMMPMGTLGQSWSLSSRLSVPASWAQSVEASPRLVPLALTPTEAAPQTALGIPPRAAMVAPPTPGGSATGPYGIPAELRGTAGIPGRQPENFKPPKVVPKVF